MSYELDGGKWDWVEQFDCRIFSAKYFQGGSFFTAFPISPNFYLMGNKTKANVDFYRLRNYTLFVIVDDWGQTHKVKIPNKYTNIIENAIFQAKQINEAIDYVRR